MLPRFSFSPGEDLFGAVNIGPSAACDVSDTKEFGSTTDETSHGKMNSPSPSSSFGIQHLEIVFTFDKFEFGSCTQEAVDHVDSHYGEKILRAVIIMLVSIFAWVWLHRTFGGVIGGAVEFISSAHPTHILPPRLVWCNLAWNSQDLKILQPLIFF